MFEELITEIQSICYYSNDLRLKKYQNSSNKLMGHCYVASEAIYHILGGKRSGFVPHFIKVGNEPHWFLKHISGYYIIDPTRSQFKTIIPEYHKAKGKGFLTKQPSKRAQTLIKRWKERR